MQTMSKSKNYNNYAINLYIQTFWKRIYIYVLRVDLFYAVIFSDYISASFSYKFLE
jgi:hypothetical protein